MDHSEIHKKLVSPLPMRGIEKKIYIAVFLCIVSGVFLSFSFRSWSWINAFGALIIIIGIWFTWRDFVSGISGYSDAKQNELLQLISKYKNSKPRGLLAAAQNKGGIQQLDNSHKDLVTLKNLMIKRLRFMEATILILGTFINGFSGAALDILFPFK